MPAELWKRVDNWRRAQEDIPNPAETLRRLVEIALDVEEGAERKHPPKGKHRP